MLKKFRKPLYIALIVIVSLALVGAAYLTFFYARECQNYECFKEHMKRCSKATFINEEPEASWKYRILGKEENQCVVEVTLLLPKQGELEIIELTGQKMECSYPLGQSAYPEKDLAKCHGLLKEGLQELIIKKLHAYLIENLGKFDEGLSKAI